MVGTGLKVCQIIYGAHPCPSDNHTAGFLSNVQKYLNRQSYFRGEKTVCGNLSSTANYSFFLTSKKQIKGMMKGSLHASYGKLVPFVQFRDCA